MPANCTGSDSAYQSGTSDASCTEIWANTKLQKMDAQINVGSNGKIVYPKFYAEDFAGNAATISSVGGTVVNYSLTPRGKSTDFRLFVDNLASDVTKIDTSNWKDGKDGVVADGLTPELDRLTDSGERWVIRGNTIKFKIKAEQNTRAIVNASGVFKTINPTNVNCVEVSPDVIENGIITKSGKVCDLTFDHTWTGTGSQNANFEALDYKNFSVTLIDLAGNASIESPAVAVWNDRTAPIAGKSTITSTDSSKLVNGNSESNLPGERLITNSSTIEFLTRGEVKSDLEIEIYKDNVLVSKRLQRNGQLTSETGAIEGVGNVYDCSANNCIQTQTKDNGFASAKFTISSDGVYTIRYRNTDTAGNIGAYKESVFEKDTVSPTNPVIEFQKTGTAGALKIIGEANSKANIKIGNSSISSILDGNGIFQNSQIIPYISCGITYTVTVSLTDRAGNQSGVVSKSITGETCPVPVFIPNGSMTGVTNVEYEVKDFTSYNNEIEILKTTIGKNMNKFLTSEYAPCIEKSLKSINEAWIDWKLANDVDKYATVIVDKCNGYLFSSGYREVEIKRVKYILNIYRQTNGGIQSLANIFMYFYKDHKQMIDDYLPLVASVAVDIACGIILSGTVIAVLTICPAFGAGAYVGVQAFLKWVNGEPLDFGNLSIEFVKMYLIGLLANVGGLVIIGGVKYLWSGSVDAALIKLSELILPSDLAASLTRLFGPLKGAVKEYADEFVEKYVVEFADTSVGKLEIVWNKVKNVFKVYPKEAYDIMIQKWGWTTDDLWRYIASVKRDGVDIVIANGPEIGTETLSKDGVQITVTKWSNWSHITKQIRRYVNGVPETRLDQLITQFPNSIKNEADALKYVKIAIEKGIKSGPTTDTSGNILMEYIYDLDGKNLTIRVNPERGWFLTAF